MFEIEKNYLIYIFCKKKYIHSFYTDEIEDVVSYSRAFRDCEIKVLDLQELKFLTKSEMNMKIMATSLEKLKAGISSKPIKMEFIPEKQSKIKKYWKQPIKCVETGEIFSSVRECSKHFKIPYKSLWNAINSGNARDGYHFINVKGETNQ